jgi:hypothetical protein
LYSTKFLYYNIKREPMKSTEDILIAGGYGVVGQQLAQLIRRYHPTQGLLLAGRNPTQAEALAQRLTCAEGLAIDVSHPNPLNGRKPRAILSVVNDPSDFLLLEAAQNGIAYLDITRWTERVKTARMRLSGETLNAPVLLSSAWMAGVAALLAVSLARQLTTVERIDISILYSLQDKAGPNSTEYMDRLATRYPVMIAGKQSIVDPLSDPRKVKFPGNYLTKVYRFDTPEQLTLPDTTQAGTVAARIAFDDAFSTRLLVFLTRSGIWSLLSGERWTAFRRSMLYHPGKGAPHEMVVEVAGVTQDHLPKRLRAELVDPQGQTHLTAVGAFIQMERLLGLDGLPAPAPGILYPDTAPNLPFAFRMLEREGITIKLVEEQGLKVRERMS